MEFDPVKSTVMSGDASPLRPGDPGAVLLRPPLPPRRQARLAAEGAQHGRADLHRHVLGVWPLGSTGGAPETKMFHQEKWWFIAISPRKMVVYWPN